MFREEDSHCHSPLKYRNPEAAHPCLPQSKGFQCYAINVHLLWLVSVVNAVVISPDTKMSIGGIQLNDLYRCCPEVLEE